MKNGIFKTYLRLLFLSMTGYIFLQCSPETDDPEPVVITPENALEMYLNNGDETYGWEVKNTLKILDLTVDDVLLTSQQWHGYTWKHQLTVVTPDDVQHDEALLWITGGSLENDEPEWADLTDQETLALGMLASSGNAIVAILRQTPNQPLLSGLSEDALISATLNNFKSDGDYSWPLLFPMVKSAVRAMDAVQELSSDERNLNIPGFVVAGASKRGWTTWLTGASDQRVKAIAPAVIDMVNMPVNLDYQLEVWGEYSEEIRDYVDLGIPQEVHTGLGQDLSVMIDPYAYLDKLTMPKMIFIGTNDPYWPVDAIKHYFDDLQGDNFIHYVANAGHDLDGGEQAIKALNAFFLNTAADHPYPECSWEMNDSDTGISLHVTGTAGLLEAAYLWKTTSEDRDFRDEFWTAEVIEITDNDHVNVSMDYPEAGFLAFYIDFAYRDLHQNLYTISTRMFVADEDEVL